MLRVPKAGDGTSEMAGQDMVQDTRREIKKHSILTSLKELSFKEELGHISR